MTEKECVFCNSKNFGDRLLSQNEHALAVATIGQIITGYALLIPKEHISCFGALPQYRRGNITDELLKADVRIKNAIRESYNADSVLTFEHGVVGQTVFHAHKHFLPTDIDLTPIIEKDFPDSPIDRLSYETDLQLLYRRHPEPYIAWTDKRGDSMVAWNPPAIPMYLRIVAANLLGHPERANWREMDPNLDAEMQKDTISKLKNCLS